MHIFSLVTDNNPSWIRGREDNDQAIILLPQIQEAKEIISWSISAKVWHWARIKLSAPGSAVRHVTNCTTWAGLITCEVNLIKINYSCNMKSFIRMLYKVNIVSQRKPWEKFQNSLQHYRLALYLLKYAIKIIQNAIKIQSMHTGKQFRRSVCNYHAMSMNTIWSISFPFG